MNINGKVRMACSALVDKLEQPITLEPMRKFPMVRDLAVDRTRMFESLKRVKAWIELDGTYNLGPGPRQSQSEQAQRYVLSTCITCGSCLEACPQVTQDNDFIGAAADQPGAAVQPPPHRGDERRRPAARPDGRRAASRTAARRRTACRSARRRSRSPPPSRR